VGNGSRSCAPPTLLLMGEPIVVRVAWELVTVAPSRCASVPEHRDAVLLGVLVVDDPGRRPRSLDRPGPVITPRAPHLAGTTLGTRRRISISSGGRPQFDRGAHDDKQYRALRLLADAPHGRAVVADMLAHGFTNALLDRLARDGLTTIQPGTISISTRRYYRYLGGDHRSRSASARRQAAGRVTHRASSIGCSAIPGKNLTAFV
jgi:hypothetical protein